MFWNVCWTTATLHFHVSFGWTARWIGFTCARIDSVTPWTVCSPPASPVHGMSQAKTPEWDVHLYPHVPGFPSHWGHHRALRTVPCATQEVLISFYFIRCVCAQMLRHLQLFCDPRTVARQAPLSMGFSRQEYWSGLPCPSPGDLPNSGIKPRCPALQADSLLSEPPRKHFIHSSVYMSTPVSQFILPQPHLGFTLAASEISLTDIFLMTICLFLCVSSVHPSSILSTSFGKYL